MEHRHSQRVVVDWSVALTHPRGDVWRGRAVNFSVEGLYVRLPKFMPRPKGALLARVAVRGCSIELRALVIHVDGDGVGLLLRDQAAVRALAAHAVTPLPGPLQRAS
jgi:hypothetical protein